MEEEFTSSTEGTEVREVPGAAQPTATSASHRRVIYFFTYLGTLIVAVLILDIALLFPEHSLAYQWMNRLGIFLAVIIVIGLFFLMEWGSTRPWPDLHTRSLRWYMRVLGVLLPILFTLKARNRILQAFWLR